MRKGHLTSVFYFIILVMMTLPISAQTILTSVDQWFFGELDQWDFVPADTVHSSGGQLKSLKAVQTHEDLYLYVEGINEVSSGVFYLDTGQDPFGYLGRGLWGDEPRIDYKVESGVLWSYDGTGFSEAWRERQQVDIAVEGAASVVRITLKDLGLRGNQPIRVSFFLNGLNYLPHYGASMLTATQVDKLPDWQDVTGVISTNPPRLTVNAIKDHKKLFVRVLGTDLNPKNTYFIDTRVNAGCPLPQWSDGSADYKVENGTLYFYDNDRWMKKGPVYTYTTSGAILMSVDLSLLGVEPTDPLRLAYLNNKEHMAPDIGEPMLEVKRTLRQPIEEDAFYPVEYHGELNNPYKGWAPSALYGPYSQPHRLVHAYISWRELEPERGVFDWEGLETKNNFDHWTQKGVKIIPRIIMDYPTADPSHMDIPDWLYQMIDGDGIWYQTNEIGSGFSPNYENPILIAEHERMIKAFGERYNDDPRIAFIQLGSVGHWGEWHTWPEGSGAFPREEVANAYMQHYMDYLDNKMLGIRRPFPYTRDANFGYFNDRIGHAPTTEQWLFWINNGLEYENWYNRQIIPGASVSDFWHTAYSAGEFSDGNALAWLRDDTVSDTLRQVRESHTSWIGPCSPASYGNIPEQPNINEVLRTLGYHFVIEKVVHEPQTRVGSNFEISMVWNNKGVAPFYFPWPIEIGLVNSQGELQSTFTTQIDIRKLLPGRHTLTVELPISPSLPEDQYTLTVAVIEPETGKPGVDLAIEGRRDDGRYLLSTIYVVDQ